MAELVECARLEIAYSVNTIEGSNPPISAINKKTTLVVGFLFIMEILYGIRATTKLLVRDEAKRSERGPTQSVGNYNPPISAINKR